MQVTKRFLKKSDTTNELLDLSRIVSEVEYLLVLLVVFYLVIMDHFLEYKFHLIIATSVCTAFIIIFHYVLRNKLNRRLLGLEALIITGYITYVLWYTGKTASPLVELYMITIVSSALMLGVVTTLLLAGLVTACLFYFDFDTYSFALFSTENTLHLIKTVVMLYTLMLIAYLTLMLSTYMERAHNRIKLLSEHDELTGLLNMRAFTAFVTREFKQSARFHKEFAVLMIDADNLKTVNDRFGHTAGDSLIINIAEKLKETIRTADILARYGGDEFILLLPETDAIGALNAAQRMRVAVEASALQFEQNAITTSISIGLACYPQDSQDLEEVIQQADHALYASKRKGKNIISIYSEISTNC
jgi:diguanylate cyclase (GGDEF)-like protein